MFPTLPLTTRNLIITGYVEPNKPRIAQRVALQLKMQVVDVEQQLEQRFGGETVARVRERYGERHFKSVEAEVMSDMTLYRNTVIRVMSSTLTNSDHLARMQETGIIICLVARLDAILRQMHLSLGARYHDPAERAMALGELRREWAIRKYPNIHELDATYKDEAGITADIIGLWQQVAIERA
jgi:shikimate kinase